MKKVTIASLQRDITALRDELSIAQAEVSIARKRASQFE
jgi:hypothetical protein